MALVSYDYNSESDADITDEDEPSTSQVTLPPSTLFSNLPQIKTNTQITGENDQLEDFIPTVKTIKEKKKVQITIPSLSDFADDDTEPTAKKTKPSPKGSGLLGLLPPVTTTPISSTMFVPNTVKKKASGKPLNVKPLKKPPQKTHASDSDGDETPETFDPEMWEKVCGRTKQPIKVVEVIPPPKEPEFTIAPEADKPYDGLDNEAFKELVGNTKRPLGNIRMIDINEEEILPDKDLWMTKSLTDPELAPKPKEEDGVDPTKRRKHHITYLAQQAKANEQDLKTAWASSKNTRLMSRAKYGF